MLVFVLNLRIPPYLIIVIKTPLSEEEDAIIIEYRQRETDCGWAKIATVIYKELKIKRTPNQLKNNYN